MELTPRAELDDRLRRLQARLAAAKDAEALVILQGADLFYFSGTLQDAWLVIPQEGPPLMLVRRSLERARAESALDRQLPFTSPREIPKILAAHGLGGLRRVGLEFDVLPVDRYVQLGRLFPTTQFVDASRLIREVRMLKSPFEVERIRRAAAIQDRMAQRVREVLRPGITELALAAEVEAEARRHGHEGMVRMRRFNQQFFFGHLLSGESGAVPSWLEAATGGSGLSPAFGTGAGLRQVRPHEPVLLDYAGVFGGYHADQTRLFSLGALPDELRRGYNACRAIHATVVEGLRPGAVAEEIFAQATAVADRLGYADRFMNTGSAQVRFVGHGVGVELDELPILAPGSEVRLEAGMVLAVEPKIVFPGLGMVGLEDTVLVTEGDPEYLTTTPREIAIV